MGAQSVEISVLAIANTDTVQNVIKMPMVKTWGGFEVTVIIPWCARVHYWFIVDGKRRLLQAEPRGAIMGGKEANEFWMPYRGAGDSTKRNKAIPQHLGILSSCIVVACSILAVILSYTVVHISS